jgi:hypothetical protein
MRTRSLLQRACLDAAAFLALAVLLPTSVVFAEWTFRPKSDSCVEVDGAYAQGAQLLTAEGSSKVLVDIPSLSTTVLINMKTEKAVKVPPSLIKRDAADGRIRVVGPVPSDASACELSIEGPVLRFRVDGSEVRAHQDSSCQPAVVPGWTAGPITDDPAARKCLHLEEKPIAATAGCLKVESLRNSCDAPVMAVVLTTQHLLSGTLPETSSVLIPPGSQYSLGCAWSSGATSPTVFEVRAAAFLPKTKPAAGRTGSTGH